MMEFHSLTPWTMELRGKVLDVAENMDAQDAEEIYGLRPLWHNAEEVVADIGGIIRAGGLLEGFLATKEDTPIAVALAFRNSMPRVAELAMFGRGGEARAMPAVYEELHSRAITFGAKHGLHIAQVPVLSTHRAARRKLRSLGGFEAFDYGPIGTRGQTYVHTIWRF